MENNYKAPEFLESLLNARSPSGYEFEAQVIVDQYVKECADEYRCDALGNRIAVINPKGKPRLLLSGHMDELGLMITYIDENGFLYFDTIGGMDLSTVSGRRVRIMTKGGIVKGVTGRRAIHLLSAEERKKIPEKQNLWIDIGVKSQAEAKELVRVGDVAVYDQSFELIRGSIGVARAFDNKAGCYVVCETLRRLANDKKSFEAKVTAVATSQEEIGCRGARAIATGEPTDFSIAVDVGHSTDHPECDNRRFGEFKQGKGPIITRGSNANPKFFDIIIGAAEGNNIPYQLEGDPRPTATDGRELQMGIGGIATAVISIPLRYMHTPSEIVDLEDIEQTVQLLTSVAKALKSSDSGIF